MKCQKRFTRWIYRGFHEKGTFSVHSFNDDYLSIPVRPGSYKYLFHEIPCTTGVSVKTCRFIFCQCITMSFTILGIQGLILCEKGVVSIKNSASCGTCPLREGGVDSPSFGLVFRRPP